MAGDEKSLLLDANKKSADLEKNIKWLTGLLQQKDDLLAEVMDLACKQSQHISFSTSAAHDTLVWDPLSS